MKGWELCTPAERRLALLLFALAALGKVAHLSGGLSPQVAAWLEGNPHPDRPPADTASVPGPAEPRPAAGPVIPSRAAPAFATAAPETVAPIDPNVADLEALVRLPGVGPVLAHRILEDRVLHGPYVRPEDLLRVPGIGPATLARLRPHLAFPGR